MLIKIHEAYRRIVAVCDAELLGRRFEQGKMQLEVKEDFYNGEKKTEAEVIEILRIEGTEDATFNLVGKKAVNAGIRAGIINKGGIIKIRGVPHALGLF